MTGLHHEVRLFRAVEQARDVYRNAHVPLPVAAIDAARQFGVDPGAVLQFATTAEESLAEWRQARRVSEAHNEEILA